MNTFSVNNIKLCTDDLKLVGSKDVLEALICAAPKYRSEKRTRTVEAFGFNADGLAPAQPFHGLVSAALSAFKSHYAFTFTPDTFWITLVQGLALHINQNSRSLRSKFVAHQGSKLITVIRNDFTRGSPDNDWPSVFSEFSSKIKEDIGDNYDNLVSKFSTSTAIDIAANEIALMDSMKSYFDYRVMTLCGIPQFTVEGTKEDWQLIKSKIKGWSSYGLKDWVQKLNVIVDQFISTFDGNVDTKFWDSFFKENHMSGGNTISGWVNDLFPYLKSYDGNIYKNEGKGEVKTSSYPASLSSVPFIWKFGTEYKYEFIAGLVGFTKTADHSLKPVSGWGVSEKI